MDFLGTKGSIRPCSIHLWDVTEDEGSVVLKIYVTAPSRWCQSFDSWSPQTRLPGAVGSAFPDSLIGLNCAFVATDHGWSPRSLEVPVGTRSILASMGCMSIGSIRDQVFKTSPLSRIQVCTTSWSTSRAFHRVFRRVLPTHS
ncbi:hypothetical protein ABKN59_006213 [Abortiporus biennis]